MKQPRRRSPKQRRSRAARSPAVAAAPVTAAQLRKLRNELQRRLTAGTSHQSSVTSRRKTRDRGLATGGRRLATAVPLRWNPQTEDVQRSVAQLVLTIVEFLRQLMERQAIRRMQQKTLTRQEVEAVGRALMQLEETIREIGARFGLSPEDLNLDLGPIGKLM